MFGNRGYVGSRMSVRAVEAYHEGKKPLSKWTKTEILDECELQGATAEELAKLKSYRLKDLRECVLTLTEWHHTGKFFNETNFYAVCFEDEKNEIFERLEQCSKAPTKKEEPQIRKARCKFLTWGGTRNHPKAYEHEEIGEIKGNWFYCSVGKKSINANGFKILEEF